MWDRVDDMLRGDYFTLHDFLICSSVLFDFLLSLSRFSLQVNERQNVLFETQGHRFSTDILFVDIKLFVQVLSSGQIS